MHRRTLALVALLALVVTAGCHSVGRLQTTAVDDRALAAEASVDVDDRFALAERRTIRSAIRNGSALANGTEPPIDVALPVTDGDGFYRLDRRAVGNASGVEFHLAIDYNASDPSGDRIAYESLPRVDRLALRPLVTDPYDPGSPLLEAGTDTYDVVTYTDAERSRSVLADGQRYDVVTYEGETYPIAVRESEPVQLTTYRYESALVASGADAYGSRLRERYAFTLSDLSEAERDVLESALDDEYYAESVDDEGFDGLVDRFLDREAVVRDRDRDTGSWVVRYDGRLYWAELDYGAFVDAEDRAERSTDGSAAGASGTESPIAVTPIGNATGAAGDASTVVASASTTAPGSEATTGEAS